MSVFKTKSTTKVDIPEEFTQDIIATMNRIEHNISVTGILYAKNDTIVMNTVPRGVAVLLNKRLPLLNNAIARAVKEIDVMDELIAYRIVSKHQEIAVATGPDFAAAVVHLGENNSLHSAHAKIKKQHRH